MRNLFGRWSARAAVSVMAVGLLATAGGVAPAGAAPSAGGGGWAAAGRAPMRAADSPAGSARAAAAENTGTSLSDAQDATGGLDMKQLTWNTDPTTATLTIQDWAPIAPTARA